VDRPEVEEYTLAYKAKQGLKGLQYLLYLTGAALLGVGVFSLVNLIKKTYLRYKISQLPPEQQE
jgi:hypothetical protein